MTSENHINKSPQRAQRTTNAPRRRLYDLKSAAEYLGRTVWGVRELVWKGALPVVKDGRKQYVDIFDLNNYIEQNKTTFI